MSFALMSTDDFSAISQVRVIEALIYEIVASPAWKGAENLDDSTIYIQREGEKEYHIYTGGGRKREREREREREK